MPARPLASPEEWPEGFRYEPNFLTQAEHAELLRIFQTLPFAPFDFHGYIAKRRIVEYGWEYDFGTRKATTAQPLPDYLIPLRERAADQQREHFASGSAETAIEVARRLAEQPSPSGQGTLVAAGNSPRRTRAPSCSSEDSTAAIIRTTSVPISADERGRMSRRIAVQKSAISS